MTVLFFVSLSPNKSHHDCVALPLHELAKVFGQAHGGGLSITDISVPYIENASLCKLTSIQIRAKLMYYYQWATRYRPHLRNIVSLEKEGVTLFLTDI